MKKIVIALCLGVASSYTVAADWTAMGTPAAVCTAGTGSAVTAVASSFVKSAFTPKCSTNTSVYFDATGANAAVGSISTKGNQSFKGNTNGGAVVKHGDCASTGCVGATEAAAALTQALADASS